MVEGLADALAIAARDPLPVVSLIGLPRAELAAALLAHGVERVDLWPDLDGPGERAARGLAQRLADSGVGVKLRRVSRGGDPGDAGAAFGPVDAASLADYVLGLERDGMPGWEARRVAAVMLDTGVHDTKEVAHDD